MKILVTGGAGFIASHVVDLYLERGQKVVVVDNLSTGRVSNLNPNAVFYQMDIRSPQLAEVFKKERPDIVNHHAAQMDVRRSVADPIYDSDVNIIGSLNLIECAKLYDVQHFIYISSGGAVYGEPEYLPCDEEHPIKPICQYGASKHTVEHYLYMYRENYGLGYTVLRYPNVYGPRQDPQGEAGVVAIFIGKMLTGDQVTINGDGEQQRDFVYVADCAEANLLALNDLQRSGIYNLGSGEGTSVNEIFATLRGIIGYEQDPIYGPPKVGETRRIYLNAERAIQDLGWKKRWSLEDGLRETVRYFRSAEMVEPVALASVGRSSAQTVAGAPVDGPQKGQPSQREALGEAARGDGDELRVLEELGQRLESLPFSKRWPADLLDIALRAVRARGGSIIILDQAKKIIGAAASFQGVTHELNPKELQMMLDRGLAGWVTQHGRAALISNSLEDARWATKEWEQAEASARSVISVPLFFEGRVSAVLTLTRENHDCFTHNDLALVSSLAAMTSVSQEGIQLPVAV